MHEEIVRTLHQVEREFGCRVLYACESGSRAWGFASPDSDYDVRFVYVHPLPWYLRLDSPPDTIEAMLPGDLDLSGWELRKTLRLFAGCNPALNEWLGSPIVYQSAPGFHPEMLGLVRRCFKPRKAAHHYLQLARKSLGGDALPQRPGAKPLLYAVRALLAVDWILRRGAMPPTPFAEMLQPDAAPAEALEAIRQLRDRKRTLAETATVAAPPALASWIADTLRNAESALPALPTHGCREQERLNGILRKWVGLAL